MHVVLCQPDSVWQDPAATGARVHRLLGNAAPPPGALIVLPEMWATGFSMDVDATAEAPGGPTELFLRDLARTHDSCVLAGLVTQWQGAPRNQALAVAPDGTVLARYTKQRPFSLAREADSFPGGTEAVVFEWGGFRVAPLICYDLRFPELFRAATAQGATLLTVIANWPSPRHHHWRSLLVARAIENQAAVVGVNRSGHDPTHTYIGGSLAIDPQGTIVAEADERESAIIAELDPSDVAAWRAAFPALHDAGLAQTG